MEQALLTVLVHAEEVLRAVRYSTRPEPPAVRYGATIDTMDRWRLFVACVGTARQNEKLQDNRFFRPDDEV